MDRSMITDRAVAALVRQAPHSAFDKETQALQARQQYLASLAGQGPRPSSVTSRGYG
jgi:hypothetical protein